MYIEEYEILDKMCILQELDIIFEKLTLINSCIVFYNQLIDLRKTNYSKYAKVNNFFNSVTRGYDYSIACELPKLFNEKEQKGSIQSIAKLCKSEGLIRKKDFDVIVNRIKEKENSIIELRKYRDKVLAHSDKEYFVNNRITVKTPFDLEKYNELNRLAIDILSDIRGKVENCNFIFAPNMVFDFDLKNIIELL